MTAPHYHSHVDDPAAVGRRLKEARLAAGLSQRQLSFPGCSAAYISRLEAGDRVPSLQLLRKLALKLNARRGVPRHRRRARRAGAAGARGGGGCASARRPRAGKGALRAGARGDERARSARTGRPGARAASRRDGRRRAGGGSAHWRPRRPHRARARPLGACARVTRDGDAAGSCTLRPGRPRAARIRRRSQASVARGWHRCGGGGGWWFSRPRTTLRLAWRPDGPRAGERSKNGTHEHEETNPHRHLLPLSGNLPRGSGRC